MIRFCFCAPLIFLGLAFAQSKSERVDKFRQLEEILPTPNAYRTASGAPGHRYWQQRADYVMDLVLDDEHQTLSGSETITYYNQSPDNLPYLWVQLDQNRFAKDADLKLIMNAPDFDVDDDDGGEESLSVRNFKVTMATLEFDGGYTIKAVRDANGKDLRHTIVKTMMRIDLPKALKPGEQVVFSIDWSYPIANQRQTGGRAGYEYFEKDGNYLYEIAQFFPRMASYTDVNGWHHKQFLGDGEFTLEFGDYKVSITAPDDHVVASTGVLQNPDETLTSAQRKRLKQAETADAPVFIITEDEAIAAESGKPGGTKTWVYHAENVRDFAFASSRKFIWDAWGYRQGDDTIMAMSYYPKEGNPLWETYSTHAIVHTLEHYTKYTFDYPYPVAISVNGPVGGMEYPMICFNGPRPEEDKTYSKRTKYGLISVIIHEVGHNYFPMIVNSDERQWTWMDEGLNSFVQVLAEQSWEEAYPSRRGEPEDIVAYMVSDNQVPIMTNSESILQFGNNAYGKPAIALNILRETIMGRELFDFAFREYATRWKFKRPMPADFFRTMEDASAIDLDWFWRGWFYSTDHVDISIENMRLYRLDGGDPEVEKPLRREEDEATPLTLSAINNKPLAKRVDKYPNLLDFYNENDEFTLTPADKNEYTEYLEKFTEQERKLLTKNKNFYVVDFANIGGLVMPLILEVTYSDGLKEEIRIPAEIWRNNNSKVSKMLVTEKEITSILFDPHLETADSDTSNNHYPRKPVKSRFRIFKDKKKNLMQRMNEKLTPEGEAQ